MMVCGALAHVKCYSDIMPLLVLLTVGKGIQNQNEMHKFSKVKSILKTSECTPIKYLYGHKYAANNKQF